MSENGRVSKSGRMSKSGRVSESGRVSKSDRVSTCARTIHFSGYLESPSLLRTALIHLVYHTPNLLLTYQRILVKPLNFR